MNEIMDNIKAIWGGWSMPLPDTHYLDCHVYIAEGSTEARAIIAVFNFEEDYEAALDVVLEEKIVKRLYQLENFFKAPSIVAVGYCNRQIWMNVATLYRLTSRRTGKPEEMTHEGKVYIPKEEFNHLVKETKRGGNNQEVEKRN